MRAEGEGETGRQGDKETRGQGTQRAKRKGHSAKGSSQQAAVWSIGQIVEGSICQMLESQETGTQGDKGTEGQGDKGTRGMRNTQGVPEFGMSRRAEEHGCRGTPPEGSRREAALWSTGQLVEKSNGRRAGDGDKEGELGEVSEY